MRFLVAKYPREEWWAHDNIHGLASMWLERHDMFREIGGLLEGAIAEHREGKTTPDAFARFFAPRLRFFLGQLEGHHAIEDEHYFPLFAKAESRLARGFGILDGDHHVIHDALERNADAANALPAGAATKMPTGSASPPMPMPTRMPGWSPCCGGISPTRRI